MLSRRVLLLVALVACAAFVAHAQDYDYEYGYDQYEDDLYSYDDEYNYYGDDDEAYYDYYGYYADDFDGYDDYYDDEEYAEDFKDCYLNANGKPQLTNGTASCDLKITGADKQADLLKGGVDGVYQLVDCHNGKPLYKRKDSPAGEDRIIWYSNSFDDWDLSRGAVPVDEEILIYGGEAEQALVPLYVKNWHLQASYKSASKLMPDDYLPISLQLTCADGKVPKQSTVANVRTGPLITDQEMEQKYKIIYERYGKRPEPNPVVNFTFVVLLVMTGLTIVLALPYFLLRKKGGKGNVATSFAQMLQQSRKKNSGHYN